MAEVNLAELYWRLDGHTPVPCTIEEWGAMFNDPQSRIVEQTRLNRPDEEHEILVSTVFLGIDHGFGSMGNIPILFETMIFNGRHSEFQERYATWDQAVEGHVRAVARANRMLVEEVDEDL